MDKSETPISNAMKQLKIVTYNVNGLRQRISQYGSLLQLLNSLDADIICFQEIKLTKQELTADLVIAEGYESFFSCTRTSGKGRTGYSGVATFCRVKSAFSSMEVALPVGAEEGFTGLFQNSSVSENGNVGTFSRLLCLENFSRDELIKIDSEGRCIITDHGHFVLFNLYGPRADPDDAERVQFKANFFKILQKRWELLQQEGRRIVVVGDLNIAPAAIDRCEAGPDFEQNEFRRWFRSLLVNNRGSFIDIFRAKHPDRMDAYTCWPVHTGAEEFNFGSRIDHIIASGSCLHEVSDQPDHNLLDCHVLECDIMTQFKRWKPGSIPRWKGGKSTKLEGSDHAPVYMTLKDIPDIPLHSTPSLSARYIAEIRGSQQTIVSVLLKRQMSEQLNSTSTSSSPVDEDTHRLCLSESVNRTIGECGVSSIQSNELCATTVDSKDTNSNNSSKLVAGQGPREECGKRKKTKQNQRSQLSLRSFFQTVPNCNNDSDSAKGILCNQCNTVTEPAKDISRNQDNAITKAEDHRDEVQDCYNESYSSLETSQPSLSLGTPEKELDLSCSEKKEKKDAVMEWRRIQQKMQESIPLCNGHREPCVARVVKKPGLNFGRRFYVCARSQGPASNPETRCDFFRWAASKSKQHK